MAIRKDTTLSEESMNQVRSIFYDEPAKEEKKTVNSTDKKDYSDNYILRMPKGERSRVKMFCASKDVSMSSFIMFAIDYLMDEVEEGRLSVSKTGVKTLHKVIEQR